jgi:ERCC4-type nuclease
VLFVSSTERPAFTKHLPEHRLSTLPERYGCDVLWNVKGEWWGVQRKELGDFIASVLDGRMAKEVGQMKQTPMPHVVIEGRVSFSQGVLVWSSWGQEVTESQWHGMLWSLQYAGVTIGFTGGMRETAGYVTRMIAWSEKGNHTSMNRRPGPVGKWGKATSREFGEHLLMGLPGVGPELAGRVMDRFGRVPWKWDVSEEELMSVDGVGRQKAKTMLEAFG